MTLPTAYCPLPFKSGDLVTYMTENVGRILCPQQWEPGWDDPSFVDTMAAQVGVWRGYKYPWWLVGIRVRWDFTGGSMATLPDDSMIAWGSKAEQDILVARAESIGGNYAYPGQVFDTATRKYEWPTTGSAKTLHRAAYFQRLQSLHEAEGLVPVPHGTAGIAIDPREGWPFAADRVSSMIDRCEAGWLVHSGNKTPHFHSGGMPGQNFKLHVPWSLDEFRDSVAEFYRAIQRHNPLVRILKIELPEQDGPNSWLEDRGVTGVWNYSQDAEGLAVPLSLGPP